MLILSLHFISTRYLSHLNHLRWQPIADHNEWPNTIIRRFLFEFISLDRNYWEVINLLLVLPILFYLNIIKTEEIL